jgi:hypothetical protein
LKNPVTLSGIAVDPRVETLLRKGTQIMEKPERITIKV